MKLEASSLKRNKVDKPKVRFINNRRGLKSIKLEMKRKKLNGHHRNTKDYKRLQQATIHQ